MTADARAPAKFARRDVAEIVVGACVMAFPVATTGEVWDLGEQLSLLRVMLFALASVFFLAMMVFLLHHRRDVPADPRTFFLRLLSTYGLTLVIAALLLFGVDKLPLLAAPMVAIKRTILVAFPASFAATVVDSVGG